MYLRSSRRCKEENLFPSFFVAFSCSLRSVYTVLVPVLLYDNLLSIVGSARAAGVHDTSIRFAFILMSIAGAARAAGVHDPSDGR